MCTRKHYFHFQKVVVRSSRSDQKIKRISSNEVAIQSTAHQQVILRTDNIETHIDDGDLGRGEGGGAPHENGQAQL